MAANCKSLLTAPIFTGFYLCITPGFEIKIKTELLAITNNANLVTKDCKL